MDVGDVRASDEESLVCSLLRSDYSQDRKPVGKVSTGAPGPMLELWTRELKSREGSCMAKVTQPGRERLRPASQAP